MKQFVLLVVAAIVLGTVLIGCDSGPTPQTAIEREYSEGRRESPDPIAPPGPPDASMVSDDTAPPPDDDE